MRGKITVGKVRQNLAGVINIKADRSSVLGNPYPMSSEAQRDVVCNKYQDHFDRNIFKDGKFREEVVRIYKLVKSGKDVNLQCWCAPKRCHCDTIKNFLDIHLG